LVQPPSAPAPDLVLYDVADAVATVTLNRPDRLNAWTPALETAYFDALAAAAADPDVRVIVVTGAGRGFCAGADLELLDGLDLQAVAGDPRGDLFPTTLPKPVVCAINGACAGLGLAMALMCDVRFVGRGAKLTTAFSKIGLIAEHGTSWLLPRLVGHATALDLLLSSRVVTGDEAVRLGLANTVVDDVEVLAAAQGYARSLAQVASPTAMAVIKQQVYGDAMVDLSTALRKAYRLVEVAAQHEDFRNGVAALRRGEPVRHAPLAPTTVNG
jgi:enoyl-CoA hydratase/carnithine racemase